ncbi:VRR-NUC domain-containing protein [Paenibacillus larvae]
MLEKHLERKLAKEINAIGGLALKWVAPGHRGVPDRIILLPRGQVAFVEMKAPGGQPRPLQRKWHNTLRDLGHTVAVIDSLEGIERFVKDVAE